jgi:hypothetical protein
MSVSGQTTILAVEAGALQSQIAVRKVKKVIITWKKNQLAAQTIDAIYPVPKYKSF